MTGGGFAAAKLSRRAERGAAASKDPHTGTAVDAVDAAARSIGEESHAFTTQAHTMLFKSAIKSAFAAHAPLTRTNLAVGDSIPAGTTLVREFPNELVDMPARLAGKKTIVVGLPGAFTPT